MNFLGPIIIRLYFHLYIRGVKLWQIVQKHSSGRLSIIFGYSHLLIELYGHVSKWTYGFNFTLDRKFVLCLKFYLFDFPFIVSNDQLILNIACQAKSYIVSIEATPFQLYLRCLNNCSIVRRDFLLASFL